MSAPTATTATLISAYRDALDFAELAIAEDDTEATDAAMADRRRVAHTLTVAGQGWVVVLLRAEALARIAPSASPTDVEVAVAAVDKVLARTAA